MNRTRSVLPIALAVTFLPAGAARGQPLQSGARTGAGPGTVVDTLVDVGGHSLHLRVRRGSLPITVLLEAGGGADLSSWGTVPARLADRTRATIVAYDRAGLGESELGPPDLTPQQEVEDVRRALARIGAPVPTLVVGHSYGAMLALSHAGQYRAEVAGLVLVDPMNPRFVAEVGDWLDSTVPEIDEPRTDREHVIVRMAASMDALSARLRTLEPTLDVPMIIISAGQDWWGPPGVETAWRQSHIDMAAAAPARTRIIADGSGHDVPASEPDLIVAAILRLLTAALPGAAPR